MKAKAAYENNKKNNKSNSKKFSKPSKKNKLGFCDYEQRNYNFENLEAMFRGEMDYDPSLLENDE